VCLHTTVYIVGLSRKRFPVSRGTSAIPLWPEGDGPLAAFFWPPGSTGFVPKKPLQFGLDLLVS
jgi:hypothetical protein